MSDDRLNVKLYRDIDMRIYDYAKDVAAKILKADKDLNPSVRFQFDKRNPDKMIMLMRNDDAATFFAQLEYHLNDKFVIEGNIDPKIYYLLLHELGLLLRK